MLRMSSCLFALHAWPVVPDAPLLDDVQLENGVDRGGRTGGCARLGTAVVENTQAAARGDAGERDGRGGGAIDVAEGGRRHRGGAGRADREGARRRADVRTRGRALG